MRVRQLRLASADAARDMPGAVADRAFLRLLYGRTVRHSPIGSEASLARDDVDEVRMFHAGGIRPGVATLIAVGDCDHDEVVRLATEDLW